MRPLHRNRREEITKRQVDRRLRLAGRQDFQEEHGTAGAEEVNMKELQGLAGVEEFNTTELQMEEAGAEEFNVRELQALVEQPRQMRMIRGGAGRPIPIQEGLRTHGPYRRENG